MTQVQRTPKLEDLAVGRKLKSVAYHGKQYEAVVVEEDGQRRLKVGNATFKSLSAAGSSITGAACRGGVFWGLISLPTPERQAKTEQPQVTEQPTAEAEEPKAEAATPEQPKAAKPKSSARAKAKRNGEAT